MEKGSQVKGHLPRKVLIADDDHGVRAMMSFYFKALHCLPSTRSSLQTTIDELSQGKYELLILDLYLGDEPGMEVLRWMRDHELRVPTVLMSGSGDIFAIEQARRLGIIEFWPKPTRFQAAHQLAQRLWSQRACIPRLSSAGIDVIQGPRALAHPYDGHGHDCGAYCK